MAQTSCHKCKQALPHESDSWCLGCSAVEALSAELRNIWGSPGSRSVATDVVVSGLRQVRALRRLGLGAGISLASQQSLGVTPGSLPPPEPSVPPRGGEPPQAASGVPGNQQVKEERREESEESEEENSSEESEHVGASAKSKAEPAPPLPRRKSRGGETADKAEQPEERERSERKDKEKRALPSASVAGGNRRKKENKKKDEIISLDSGDDDAAGDGEGEVEKPAGMTRAGLKDLFKKAKDRMTHGGATKRVEAESEDSSGGRRPKKSRLALEERRIVSGTNFNPGRMAPLAIEDGRDTSGGGKSRLKKRTLSSRDPGDQLLAQAAQQGDNQMGKKRRKDKKDGRKVVELLKKAVGGKKKKKEKTKRKRKRKVKKEPGDPDDSDGSSSSSETSSSSSQRRGGESDSELSYEPPLRKKALSAPGSVLTDLIKHAQEQLDKGALMDHDGQPASLTSGIKLSTYFALLIRPYFPNNNPLLRELYQLAQSIDLLRMGKLAETGDALASRFVAVHTAMTDGNWQVAAQLELFPLEQVQSTTTSTMLQAQRHRRLLWKAQGFSARPFGRGRGNWQKGGGDEKGYEKGWKGKGKGRGKGKWQNQGGKDGWSNPGKGEGGNPWKDNKEETAKKA